MIEWRKDSVKAAEKDQKVEALERKLAELEQVNAMLLLQMAALMGGDAQ